MTHCEIRMDQREVRVQLVSDADDVNSAALWVNREDLRQLDDGGVHRGCHSDAIVNGKANPASFVGRLMRIRDDGTGGRMRDTLREVYSGWCCTHVGTARLSEGLIDRIAVMEVRGARLGQHMPEVRWRGARRNVCEGNVVPYMMGSDHAALRGGFSQR